MNRLSATTWIASLGLHGLLLLPLVSFAASGPREIYDEGTGNDAFRLEQGIAIDMISFGDAAERIEIAEVAPIIANPTPPPVVEAKIIEPELKDVITATQSPTETVTASEEPPPLEQPKPQEVAVIEQAAQVAVLAEKSAGQAQHGGKATALTAYVGKIHGALQRSKASVVNGGVGQVTLAFTLNANGKLIDREVIKSSGVASLDKAALDWLERADFPPLPGLLGSGQRFNVPLTFKRKSS
ncbi:MAG: TonB family protein [Hyphomicrobiaceae bacterium]